MASTPTPAQKAAYVQRLAAMAEAIRALKTIPDGVFYARVMPHMTFEVYDACINQLVGAKLITRTNNVLTWVRPL